jgi:hypothetical protein
LNQIATHATRTHYERNQARGLIGPEDGSASRARAVRARKMRATTTRTKKTPTQIASVSHSFVQTHVDEARAARQRRHEVLNPGFMSNLVRGIYAGFLIATMVWLLPGSGDHACGS